MDGDVSSLRWSCSGPVRAASWLQDAPPVTSCLDGDVGAGPALLGLSEGVTDARLPGLPSAWGAPDSELSTEATSLQPEKGWQPQSQEIYSLRVSKFLRLNHSTTAQLRAGRNRTTASRIAFRAAAPPNSLPQHRKVIK